MFLTQVDRSVTNKEQRFRLKFSGSTNAIFSDLCSTLSGKLYSLNDSFKLVFSKWLLWLVPCGFESKYCEAISSAGLSSESCVLVEFLWGIKANGKFSVGAMSSNQINNRLSEERRELWLFPSETNLLSSISLNHLTDKKLKTVLELSTLFMGFFFQFSKASLFELWED